MEPDDELIEGQLTQLYFWGGHGGVGGGDARQLRASDCTLRFCIDEMIRRNVPLAMNMSLIPDYADVEESSPKVKSSKIMGFIEKVTGKYIRPIESVKMLHPLAIRRFQRCPDWRPLALRELHDEIMAVEIEEKPKVSADGE